MYTLSKVVLHRRSSSVKGCLLSKVIFCQWSSSVKGRLLSNIVFRQRSSSAKGHLPSKVVFHQRSSSIKGRLPSKVIFHGRSSSSFGSFSLLGFSPECGSVQLSLLSFVSLSFSSSWYTSMTSYVMNKSTILAKRSMSKGS